MISVIAFLGNPGQDYRQTRHNAGWLVAAELTGTQNLAWSAKWQSEVADSVLAGRRIHLVLPQSFMNRSGSAIQLALQFHKLTPAELLVVHDDLETAFGSIRVRYGGGAGGHNGLRSIDQALSNQNYYRLKIGIGRPVHGDVTKHVLSRFNNQETIVLPLILTAAVTAIGQLVATDDQQLPTVVKPWQQQVVVAP
jgi:PTH1 family peptidyl-tRNA hydrolase